MCASKWVVLLSWPVLFFKVVLSRQQIERQAKSQVHLHLLNPAMCLQTSPQGLPFRAVYRAKIKEKNLKGKLMLADDGRVCSDSRSFVVHRFVFEYMHAEPLYSHSSRAVAAV